MCSPLLLVLYILLDPYSSMSIAYLWATSTVKSDSKLPRFAWKTVSDVTDYLDFNWFSSSFWTLDINEAFFDGFLIKLAVVVFAIGFGKYKGKLSFVAITTLACMTETILLI